MKTKMNDQPLKSKPKQTWGQYHGIISKIFKSARNKISDILPSEWAEKNRVMKGQSSVKRGPFSFKNSPYTKEIVDCAHPGNPVKRIAIMKGGQGGFSTSVVENAIGYIMAEQPGNILFLVGHEDLVKDAGAKLDAMIDGSGIRHLIRANTQRARATKSGDTDNMKEFADGYLKLGTTNHKSLRNISMRYGFIDDFESMKGATDQSGDTVGMIEQRFASFYSSMKLFYISTPERKETSNIEKVYLQGDQRRFYVPAPCCGEFITLEWETASEFTEGERAGITWDLDEHGRLEIDSVCYTCQKCGGTFDDSEKMVWLNLGEWRATARPTVENTRSYQISNLYSPPYMFTWAHYAEQYLTAHPPGQPRDESKWQTFQNLVLGQTYSSAADGISANKLQRNIRDYMPGEVPGRLSERDGNGRIVMLTLGSDLNGTEDDARLDWEIVAHAENGATYSVLHGSIGTFIRRDRNPEAREKWSYKFGVRNNVWDEFREVLKSSFVNDLTGKKMKIFCSLLDTGYMTDHAFAFIDSFQDGMLYGAKGRGDGEFIRSWQDRRMFKKALERNNLFIIESNVTKDVTARHMALNWEPDKMDSQPPGFMNFPRPEGGLYLFANYFSHFEAEEKRFDKKHNFTWVKKNQSVENHLFDCRLYAVVARDVFAEIVCKDAGLARGTFFDFIKLIQPK
jgi:phage terminase large subunit GpA-like protein